MSWENVYSILISKMQATEQNVPCIQPRLMIHGGHVLQSGHGPWAAAEPLLRGRIKVWFLWSHVRQLHQYATLFYVHFHTKTPYLIYIADSQTLNSLSLALSLLPQWGLSGTRIFSIRHVADTLPLGTRDSVSVLPLGAILNSKIKKAHKCRKCDQIDFRGTCLWDEHWNKKADCRCVQPEHQAALGTSTRARDHAELTDLLELQIYFSE